MESNNNKKKSGKKGAKSNEDKIQQKKEVNEEEKVKDLISMHDKNIQNQMQLFEELFKKQVAFSQVLLDTLERLLPKNSAVSENPTQHENIYLTYSQAYRNIAQTNISRKENFDIKVEVDDSYRRKLEEFKKRKSAN